MYHILYLFSWLGSILSFNWLLNDLTPGAHARAQGFNARAQGFNARAHAHAQLNLDAQRSLLSPIAQAFAITAYYFIFL